MPRPKPNEALTTSEQRCWNAYRAFLKEWKRAPSNRELAETLGVFPNAVRHSLGSLERKGYLEPKTITVTRLVLTWKGRQAL